MSAPSSPGAHWIEPVGTGSPSSALPIAIAETSPGTFEFGVAGGLAELIEVVPGTYEIVSEGTEVFLVQGPAGTLTPTVGGSADAVLVESPTGTVTPTGGAAATARLFNNYGTLRIVSPLTRRARAMRPASTSTIILY